MQLANFVNAIRVIDMAEFRRRLGHRSNYMTLEAQLAAPILDGCPIYWFASETFTDFVYGMIVPNAARLLADTILNATDFVRGVLLHFACREAPPGFHVLSTGKLRPTDIAFVGFAKNSAMFTACVDTDGTAPALVPAAGNLLFDTPLASLDRLLPSASIATLFLDLEGEPTQVLAGIGQYLASDAAILTHGPSSLLHGIFTNLTHAGAAKLWAQCVVEQPSCSFGYFELLDRAALGAAGGKKGVVPTACRLDPPQPASPGPYQYVDRDDAKSWSERVLEFAPARRVPFRPPSFVDEPEDGAATWRGQFGVTSQEWLYQPDTACPPLACAMLTDLRVVGTEMLVSSQDVAFTASQVPMDAAYFAEIASLFHSDARAVAGGFESARACSVTHHVKGPSIVLSNGGLPMHYHFLFDVLPRLWFLHHPALADHRLALPETLHAYQLDALVRYYDIAPERITIFPVASGCCRFERACVVPTMVSDWWAMPETVLAPRTALRHATLPSDAKFHNAKRIYVSRRDVSDGRTMVNETALVERLQSMGFVEIFPGAFPYDQEMGIFQNAEVVVGPFGSGMANLMFCAPGAKIVILQPDSTNWRIMSFVMEFLDLDYGYIFGEAFRRRSRGHNTEWLIDVDAVASRLRQIL